MKTRRTCPDCEDSELQPIQVIDMFQGGGRAGFAFTAAGAKRSVWTGYAKKTQGLIHGLMCEPCGRVLWYAMSEDEANAMMQAAAEE